MQRVKKGLNLSHELILAIGNEGRRRRRRRRALMVTKQYSRLVGLISISFQRQASLRPSYVRICCHYQTKG